MLSWVDALHNGTANSAQMMHAAEEMLENQFAQEEQRKEQENALLANFSNTFHTFASCFPYPHAALAMRSFHNLFSRLVPHGSATPSPNNQCETDPFRSLQSLFSAFDAAAQSEARTGRNPSLTPEVAQDVSQFFQHLNTAMAPEASDSD